MGLNFKSFEVPKQFPALRWVLVIRNTSSGAEVAAKEMLSQRHYSTISESRARWPRHTPEDFSYFARRSARCLP